MEKMENESMYEWRLFARGIDPLMDEVSQVLVWITWAMVALITLLLVATYNVFPNYQDPRTWWASRSSQPMRSEGTCTAVSRGPCSGALCPLSGAIYNVLA